MQTKRRGGELDKRRCGDLEGTEKIRRNVESCWIFWNKQGAVGELKLVYETERGAECGQLDDTEDEKGKRVIDKTGRLLGWLHTNARFCLLRVIINLKIQSTERATIIYQTSLKTFKDKQQ